MIAVYERVGVPETVRAAHPNALWFIIEDPDDGSPLGRIKMLHEIRRNFMQAERINFVQSDTRIDGKIIHVGEVCELDLLGIVRGNQ